MIYYGLKILSPGIFLVATCLICCVFHWPRKLLDNCGYGRCSANGVGMGLGMSAADGCGGNYFGGILW